MTGAVDTLRRPAAPAAPEVDTWVLEYEREAARLAANPPDPSLNRIEPHRLAGIALDQAVADRRRWERENRRPRALTAREALIALQFEASVVWTAGGNLRDGLELTEEDWDRVTLAMQRIDQIVEEAVG